MARTSNKNPVDRSQRRYTATNNNSNSTQQQLQTERRPTGAIATTTTMKMLWKKSRKMCTKRWLADSDRPPFAHFQRAYTHTHARKRIYELNCRCVENVTKAQSSTSCSTNSGQPCSQVVIKVAINWSLRAVTLAPWAVLARFIVIAKLFQTFSMRFRGKIVRQLTRTYTRARASKQKLRKNTK